MAVAPDASPLILLGKMERTGLLSRLYGRVIVAPAVWDEAVTRGNEMGARDAAYLQKFAQEHRVTTARLSGRERELAERLRSEAGLGRGEAEAIALARNRKALAVLDDKGARAVAFGLGMAHTGTAGVLYEAFLRRLVTYQELVEVLEELGRYAWVSSELLAGILRRAGETKEQ